MAVKLTHCAAGLRVYKSFDCSVSAEYNMTFERIRLTSYDTQLCHGTFITTKT